MQEEEEGINFALQGLSMLGEAALGGSDLAYEFISACEERLIELQRRVRALSAIQHTD
jgi:hypothetical protein